MPWAGTPSTPFDRAATGPRSCKTAVAAESPPTTAVALAAIRASGVPAIVVHGEDHLVIPLENALTVAELAGAALYKLKNAHRSWLIADPRLGLARNTEEPPIHFGGSGVGDRPGVTTGRIGRRRR
ncbi:hypothetical protein [Gordonia terrae]